MSATNSTRVCVYYSITAVPITKLFAWGEGDSGGHVLRETTSRGLSGLVCPSRTSERGGILCERRRRRGAREGACTGAATMSHWQHPIYGLRFCLFPITLASARSRDVYMEMRAGRAAGGGLRLGFPCSLLPGFLSNRGPRTSDLTSAVRSCFEPRMFS